MIIQSRDGHYQAHVNVVHGEVVVQLCRNLLWDGRPLPRLIKTWKLNAPFHVVLDAMHEVLDGE